MVEAWDILGSEGGQYQRGEQRKWRFGLVATLDESVTDATVSVHAERCPAGQMAVWGPSGSIQSAMANGQAFTCVDVPTLSINEDHDIVIPSGNRAVYFR